MPITTHLRRSGEIPFHGEPRHNLWPDQIEMIQAVLAEGRETINRAGVPGTPYVIIELACSEIGMVSCNARPELSMVSPQPKLSEGRLLGRFFAASRLRLREVAQRPGLHRGPTWAGARRPDLGGRLRLQAGLCIGRVIPRADRTTERPATLLSAPNRELEGGFRDRGRLARLLSRFGPTQPKWCPSAVGAGQQPGCPLLPTPG